MRTLLVGMSVVAAAAVTANPVFADTINGTNGDDELVGTAGDDQYELAEVPTRSRLSAATIASLVRAAETG
jgi:hypothetical protein